MPDQYRAIGVGAWRKFKAGAGTRIPAGTTICGVLPFRPRFESGGIHHHCWIVGDPVTIYTAIVLKRRSDRSRPGRVHGYRRCQRTVAAGVAGYVRLADQNSPRRISAAARQFEACPAAGVPTAATISRVFPRRARLQTTDIHRSVAGYSITHSARVTRHNRRRSRWRRHIDNDWPQHGGIANITSAVDLTDLNLVRGITGPRCEFEGAPRTR